MTTLVREFIFSLSILLALLTNSASAQQPSIKAGDSKLSGIDVVLEQVRSGKRLTTQTDDGGRFSFSNVDSGKYRLRIGCTSVGVGNSSGVSAGSAGQQGKCYAEFQIEITDKSKGNITGKVEGS